MLLPAFATSHPNGVTLEAPSIIIGCCRFRAVVRLRIYKCYELKFDWNKDTEYTEPQRDCQMVWNSSVVPSISWLKR
ncbi:hypothetical protein GGI08_001358 [Coemansia sp. S2]|nr:hypothetical protein GGI08_001358 [Coemansia sp. S2]KAJ2351731.1 hypothetical protein GGH92_001667 [Coemansia sp. RSA 2673]